MCLIKVCYLQIKTRSRSNLLCPLHQNHTVLVVLDQVRRTTKFLPKVEGGRRQNGIACIGSLPVVRRYWRQRSLTTVTTTSTKSIYRIKRLARNTNTGDKPVFWMDRILFPMDSSSWMKRKWMELRAAFFFCFFVKLVLS